MKIAICGDSYCADIRKDPYPTYPYLVAKEFNAEILCGGIAGHSLFHSYELLMEHIDNLDYIIFCVTDCARLPNRDRKGAWVNMLDEDMIDRYTEEFEKKFIRAVRHYYSELMCIEFHELAQKLMLREIDELVNVFNKKCIFFKCFNSSFCDYTFENAVWGNSTLFDISVAEEKYMTKEEFHQIQSSDWRLNHLNEKDNINMANFIIDVIKKDDFTPREIDMKEYFKDNKPDSSVIKSYWSNGHIKHMRTWKDGKENGLFISWYESGMKRSEGTYKDGELISEKYWHENGQRTEFWT